jgi:hypothetical protein
MHIELQFDDREGHAPSPQTHSLYPAARAFFRFACPCADCDGDFDLTRIATELSQGAPAARAPDRLLIGQVSCRGTRLRDSSRSGPCKMELSFRIITAFGAASPEHSALPA